MQPDLHQALHEIADDVARRHQQHLGAAAAPQAALPPALVALFRRLGTAALEALLKELLANAGSLQGQAQP